MNDKFIRVTDDFWVAPQIYPDDVKDAAAVGVNLIINNRPDGETPGQPSSAEIAAAAKAASIEYAYIPVGPQGITSGTISEMMKQIAEDGQTRTLAYCKSGTRSILAYSYAAARCGEPVRQVISLARAAGFNIAGHKTPLDLLAGARSDAGDKN